MEKYGNAATEEEMPRELLLGQSERQVEYDCAGRIIQGLVLSKAEILLNISLYFFFSRSITSVCETLVYK